MLLLRKSSVLENTLKTSYLGAQLYPSTANIIFFILAFPKCLLFHEAFTTTGFIVL